RRGRRGGARPRRPGRRRRPSTRSAWPECPGHGCRCVQQRLSGLSADVQAGYVSSHRTEVGTIMEAGTVPEKVTISHRGARYEIGRGKRFFGIWAIGAPESDPIDRWPENHDGWEQAWTRFVALETPDTITAVEPSRGRLALPRPRLKLPRPKRLTARPGMSGSAIALAGSGLLGLGVLLGLIGLFPGYIGPQSLASQPEQLVPHVLYLAAWAASTVLIASGGARAR